MVTHHLIHIDPSISHGPLTGIPICTDPELPAGTVVLDTNPDNPRHITRVRTADQDIRTLTLTDTQAAQVRDHYQAMNERAGHALDAWRQLTACLPRDVTPPPTPTPPTVTRERDTE